MDRNETVLVPQRQRRREPCSSRERLQPPFPVAGAPDIAGAIDEINPAPPPTTSRRLREQKKREDARHKAEAHKAEKQLGRGFPGRLSRRLCVYLRQARLCRRHRHAPSFVAAVARLHEARIKLMDNAPGLKVELRFPLAEDPDEKEEAAGSLSKRAISPRRDRRPPRAPRSKGKGVPQVVGRAT